MKMSNHLPRQTFSSSSSILPSTASRSSNYSVNESNSSLRISTGGPKIISAGSCLRLPTTTANKKASTLYVSEKEAMTWTPYPKYDGFTICEETRLRLLESIKGSSILSIISPPGCPDLVPRSFASVGHVDEKRIGRLSSQRNVPLEKVQTEMSLEDYLEDVKIDYSKAFKQRNRPQKNRAIWCNKVWTFDKVEKNLEYFEVINNKFNAMVISRSTQMAPVVARQTLPRSSSRNSAPIHRRAGLRLSTRRNTVDSNELVAIENELDGRLGSVQRNIAEPSARKTLPRKTASKTRKRHVPIIAVPQDEEANRKAPPKKKKTTYSPPASNTRYRTNILNTTLPVITTLNSCASASKIDSKHVSLNNRSTSRATKRCLDPVLTSQSRQHSSPASHTRSRTSVLNTPLSSSTTKNTRANVSAIAPRPLLSAASKTTSRAIASTIRPKPAPSNNRSTSQATKRCLDPVLTFQSRQHSSPASHTRSRTSVLNTPLSSSTTKNTRANVSAIAPRPLLSAASKTTSRAFASTIRPKPAPSNNRSTSQATKRCVIPTPVSPSRQSSPPASNTRFRQAAVQQLIQTSPPPENIIERSQRQRKPKKPFEL